MESESETKPPPSRNGSSLDYFRREMYLSVVKVDSSGFCEFPTPGDTKKQLLNNLIDPDASLISPQTDAATVEIIDDQQHMDEKEYWMPDRLCKICYSCEDPFTMYRRRHHCRVCGQVFCDRCCSYYIDGSWINLFGPVRACKFCSDQLTLRIDKENKVGRKNSINSQSRSFVDELRASNNAVYTSVSTIQESVQTRSGHTMSLQQRASAHLEKLVERMLTILDEDRDVWKGIVVNLVKDVVSTVDPNVKQGDSMDIRDYVKIKIIPGGSMEETIYVDGLVMRKNVYHKRMLSKGDIIRPRVLLIAGGIEFQRSDAKFSCLETLIEQENKHLEILVEKILSLKPDVIIVGKSISRRAQELLVEQDIVALQNIKESQLDRIARMLGATVLPTTDHMVQQNGDECIGVCDKFSVRVVQDDPERAGKPSQYAGILKERVCRGSSYVVLNGCPTELGCSIILRGSNRKTLYEIKKILKFSIIVAYHLRLEVAYYNNRYAIMPISDMHDKHQELEDINDDSDIEEWYDMHLGSIEGKVEGERSLLSTSLDIDIFLPYAEPIRGIQLASPRGYPSVDSLALDYQGLSCSSIIIGKGENVQKSKTEIRSMSFYGEADTTLGKFLIDRCFRQKGKEKESLVGNILVFAHRTGRLEFEISLMEGEHSNAIVGEDEDLLVDPVHLPIYTSSYCNLCENWVTPYEPLSEETWKMSLGKYFEMSFYNRSAKCRTGDCAHSLRDHHVHSFYCHTQEGRFQARVHFKPSHPFSLRVRKQLPLDASFHNSETWKCLKSFADESGTILEDFRRILFVLQKDVEELLPSSSDVHQMAMTDILKIVSEVNLAQSEINQTLESTLAEIQETVTESGKDRVGTRDTSRSEKGSEMREGNSRDHGRNDGEEEKVEESEQQTRDDEEVQGPERKGEHEQDDEQDQNQARAQKCEREGHKERGQSLSLEARYPMRFYRYLLFKTQDWNVAINSWHRYLAGISKTQGSIVGSPTQADQKAGTESTVLDGDSNSRLSDTSTSAPAPLSAPDTFSASAPVSASDSPPAPPLVPVTAAESVSVVPFSESISSSDPAGTSVSKNGISIDMSRNSHESVSKYPTSDSEPSPRLEKGGRALSSERESHDDDMLSVVTDNPTSSLKLQPAISGLREKDRKLNSMFKPGRRLSAFFNKYGFKGATSEETKFSVPIDDLLRGRFNLKPGKEGEVIAVSEDDIASIISYSLASEEYAEKFTHERGDQETANIDLGYSKVDADMPDMGADTDVPPSGQSLSVDSSATASTVGLGRIPSEVVPSEPTIIEVAGKVIETPDVPQQSVSTIAGIVKVIRQSVEFTKSSGVDEKDTGMDKNSYYVQRMRSTKKIHIKHRFEDKDENDYTICKFICHTFWATQFHAARVCYLGDEADEGFIRSLALSASWNAQGGKSGAAFSKSLDGRFVVKCISRTELQMFLDISTDYFKHLADAYIHKTPTVLCKILGIYQVGYHNKVTGKKIMEQVVVMENVFHGRNITRIFDLKGSSRARYTPTENTEDFDTDLLKRREARKTGSPIYKPQGNNQVLMDDNLMELTKGLPFPLKHLANTYLQKAIENDTEFLSSVNIVDYSILVGIDEDNFEVVVGIIDYMRQYDIIKRVERMGKSVGMIAGQAEPTIIQPSQYKKRFRLAMERNFMAVPDKYDF